MKVHENEIVHFLMNKKELVGNSDSFTSMIYARNLEPL